MYVFDRSLQLVTMASPFNHNLALLDADEHLNAETMAVIHEGFVNLVPISNTGRRAKYVPVTAGSRRGSGLIKQVKWLKIRSETVFIVMSTNGLQVYDAEVTDVKFYHCCKDHGDDDEYTIGACVIRNEMLCVGTNAGVILVFTTDETNTIFNLSDRIFAHDAAIELLDGSGDYMVSTSREIVYFWRFRKDEFRIYRKVSIPGLSSVPTALKYSDGLVFIGYDSGELCILDCMNDDYKIRMVAHRLEVSAFDFSLLKFMLLTASADGYVKVWYYRHKTEEVKCLFSFFNEDGPVYGVGFLNFNCTEFCVVTANNAQVRMYTRKYDGEENVEGTSVKTD